MGVWLHVNGEAVYGTRRAPLPEPEWGRLTVRAGDGSASLYAHVYDWRSRARLEIAGLKSIPTAARVLETGQPVEIKASAGGISLILPQDCPDERIAVVSLEIGGGL
jgi:hypothetical protein